ncbi:hypothetical protein CEXT_202491, partial [Caerostris extrusa]
MVKLAELDGESRVARRERGIKHEAQNKLQNRDEKNSPWCKGKASFNTWVKLEKVPLTFNEFCRTLNA